MNAGIVKPGQIVIQWLSDGSFFMDWYIIKEQVYTVKYNCYKCWVDDKLVIDLPKRRVTPGVIKNIGY